MIYAINDYTPSFKAGKAELYSDFDHTYCPISHADLHYTTPSQRPDFVKYCDDFKSFFDNTKDGLKFHITSGRTFGEYQTVSELIKEKGFKLPLPDTYIAKNGSDEYLRTSTDEDFYEKSIFPFKYDVTNKEKEQDIKSKTLWDGSKIKKKLKELFRRYNFRIVEADSENGIKDYGNKSLYYKNGIPDERDKTFHGTDKPEWVVGLRNDGNCKIYISYPSDMLTTPERKAALEEIQSQTDSLKMKIGRFIHQEKKGRVCEVLEPQIFTTPTHGLTKLYDTLEAVKRAKRENDLVIAAGDDHNDFEMLNPLQYITPSEDAMKDEIISDWEKYKAHPAKLIEKLDETNSAHKEIADEIRNLPFIAIAVKSDKNDEMIKELTTAFGENSKFHKIISVENADLQNGIKKAIKLYSEQNEDYKSKLTDGLRSEIYGEKKEEEHSSGEEDNKKKKGSIGAIVVLIAGISTGICALVNKFKKKKSAAAIDQKPQSSLSYSLNQGKLKA